MAGQAQRDQLRDRLRLPVAIAVTLAWMAALVASIFQHDVQPFFIATGPMGMVCGYLFAGDILRKAENGNSRRGR